MVGTGIVLTMLLAGVLPLLFRSGRRNAAWLSIAWGFVALVIGALHLVAGMSSESWLRETLGRLMGKWQGLGLVYDLPIEIGMLCGLNAILSWVAVLWCNRPLRVRLVVALGVFVLLATAAPLIPFVQWRLTVASALRESAARATAQPQDAQAQLDYATLLWGVGRKQEALAQAEKAQRLDRSQRWHYPYELGRILLSLGRAPQALAPLERAYRLQRAEKPRKNPLAERLRESGIAQEEIRRIAGDEQMWARFSRENKVDVTSAYAVALVLNSRIAEAGQVVAATLADLPQEGSLRRVHVLLLWSQGRDLEATQELPALTRTMDMSEDEVEKWARRHRDPTSAKRELQSWAEQYSD